MSIEEEEKGENRKSRRRTIKDGEWGWAKGRQVGFMEENFPQRSL